MRGEHSDIFCRSRGKHGSSPHARGAPLASRAALPFVRIIPACAGSTIFFSVSHRSYQDHPRMRGEHVTKNSSTGQGGGSSPHARGALIRGDLQVELQRIIPACAGSTTRHLRFSSQHRDHPRMRGEHMLQVCRCGASHGSSPHARGAPCRYIRASSGRRIIPACAGSTRVIPWMDRARRDHPRMRGEHFSFLPSREGHDGSSPHARGARL